MATCTMAKVRSLGLLPTSLATRALVVTFQSVTTSAHAGAAHSAVATMPGSRTVTRVLRIALMAGLLVYKRGYRKSVLRFEIFGREKHQSDEIGDQILPRRPRDAPNEGENESRVS